MMSMLFHRDYQAKGTGLWRIFYFMIRDFPGLPRRYTACVISMPGFKRLKHPCRQNRSHAGLCLRNKSSFAFTRGISGNMVQASSMVAFSTTGCRFIVSIAFALFTFLTRLHFLPVTLAKTSKWRIQSQLKQTATILFVRGSFFLHSRVAIVSLFTVNKMLKLVCEHH